MKAPRSQQEAEAPTVVFWDMDRCPVPRGVDARQVGPCIKRFLKHLGYSGRLIITAVGVLTNVPEGVLRKVSSTGIFLHHAAHSYDDMDTLLYGVTVDVKLPANVMVISTPPSYSDTLTTLNDNWGYNVIYPFPYHEDLPQGPSSINSLWSNFLRADSWPPLEEHKCSKTGEWDNKFIYPFDPQDPSSIDSRWSYLLRTDSWPPLEENKCSKTGEWVCCVCDNLDGLGAKSLIRHLSSREHANELLQWIPPCRCKHRWCTHGLDPMAETPLYYYPDNVAWTVDASLMIKRQPKPKYKNRKYKNLRIGLEEEEE